MRTETVSGDDLDGLDWNQAQADTHPDALLILQLCIVGDFGDSDGDACSGKPPSCIAIIHAPDTWQLQRPRVRNNHNPPRATYTSRNWA